MSLKSSNLMSAELDFLATPMNVEYANKAFQVIEGLHQECAVDFATKCGSTEEDVFALESVLYQLQGFPFRRNLLGTDAVRGGSVDKVFSLYFPESKKQFGELTAQNLAEVPLRSRELLGFPLFGGLPRNSEGESLSESSQSSGSDESSERGERGGVPSRGALRGPKPDRFLPPAPGAPGKPPTTPLHLSARSAPSDCDHAKEDPNEEEPAEARESHKRGGRFHRRAVPEDEYFMGSLGYGAAGDTCIYQNFQSLAPSCQESVRSLFALRQEYWEASQEPAHHCHFGLFVVVFLLAAVVGSVIRRRRYRKVIAVLDALHANPELKAAVEAKAGVSVPEVSCRVRESVNHPVRKCCRFLSMLVLSVLACLFVAVTSVVVSAQLILAISSTDADGSVTGPPAPVALAILLIVVALESTALIGIARACRKPRGSGDVPQAAAPQPSHFSTAISRLRGYLVPTTHSTPEGYAPLPAEEVAVAPSTEMVFVQQPQLKQAPAIYVPVSAAPVSAISLI